MKNIERKQKELTSVNDTGSIEDMRQQLSEFKRKFRHDLRTVLLSGFIFMVGAYLATVLIIGALTGQPVYDFSWFTILFLTGTIFLSSFMMFDSCYGVFMIYPQCIKILKVAIYRKQHNIE